jgi:branched-chain amino acid transport system ATP-binding protein
MSNLFRVEGLTKSFGGLAVSRDISLSMAAGERLALIGPNGAGKTTFVNLVTGQLQPSAGRLLEVARRKVGEIAYGQQRLLEIAIALALRPKVLLLDEPAAGVPSSDTPRIEQALERLPPSLAVLMIEHDMDLVFRFAKRVVVLAAGEIIFEGQPSEVAANSKVREAYLGNYAHARSVA